MSQVTYYRWRERSNHITGAYTLRLDADLAQNDWQTVPRMR
jgi:hypothetical protein